MENELIYKIGLGLIPKIGNVTAKRLIAYTGSIEGIFREKKQNLLKIPGIGEFLANKIVSNNILEKAEEEIKTIQKNKIKVLFYLDDHFPERLKHCEDAPILLFLKGDVNLNESKVVSIVGTRNATEYGKHLCDEFVGSLNSRKHKVLIVSGLAYGIDSYAHKAAMKNGLKTVAVLGHGLNYLYPALHKGLSRKIEHHGGLITEFLFNTEPEPSQFVKRNRIIAGLADATIVVESRKKGGALITADIANSYNRDVFAFPGKINDPFSKGCNRLIKSNRAALIEGVEDLEYIMGWERQEKENKKNVQRTLFNELDEDEMKIMNVLYEEGETPIDIIYLRSKLPVSKVSSLLLNLEFAGLIRSLPGKIYKAI